MIPLYISHIIDYGLLNAVSMDAGTKVEFASSILMIDEYPKSDKSKAFRLLEDGLRCLIHNPSAKIPVSSLVSINNKLFRSNTADKLEKHIINYKKC